MRERFARIGPIALVALMALPVRARADAGGITTLVPTKPAEVEKPPAFKGFTLNYTLQDTSGLNAVNYNNSIYQLFEPSWSLGKVAFAKSSPFSRLTIGMRWPLTYTLAGYDPTAVTPDNSHGTPTPCSNLTPSENGSINASQVQRCPYSNTYRATPGDLSITVSNPGIVTIPKVGIRFNPGIRFTVPLSYESRFATENFALQGVVGLSRNFFGDKLSVAYSFGATKYSYQSTSAQAQGSANPLPDAPISANYRSADAAATTAAFYTSPGNLTNPLGYNTDFAFSHVLSVGYNPTDKWSFSVLYVLSNGFSYAAPCGVASYGGVMTDPCANASNVSQASHQTGFSGTLNSGGWSEGTSGRAHHDSQVFYLTASYQLKDWVGLSVAWATFAPLRMPDNSWRQPFFWTNYDSFSSLNVGATFTLGYNNN